MAASLSDQIVSVIRTAVPAVVGTIIAYAASKGLNIDPVAVNAAIVPMVITAYYALVRWAEKKHPQLGWLLGYASAPSYEVATPIGEEKPVPPAGQ